MGMELLINLNAVQQLDPEGAHMAEQIHNLGHMKDEDVGWYSDLAASKYTECTPWMDDYDNAHASKKERERKAKALNRQNKNAFLQKVLNSLLLHYVPNLHSLLQAASF